MIAVGADRGSSGNAENNLLTMVPDRRIFDIHPDTATAEDIEEYKKWLRARVEKLRRARNDAAEYAAAVAKISKANSKRKPKSPEKLFEEPQ